ncbi:amidohydrolase [Arthrobacter psychrolactophilus]|uniref:Amidohydrolase n=1 Tax=Arthrobacter psychrolactophilus TaxID=92442 RepID=A0A2V5IQ96_9MICC|nr:amidohydrolase [Arthrobacter psychrolactophilus]PYI38735.1 amidohydrolase [Arthrobacter psychrolactophilus]
MASLNSGAAAQVLKNLGANSDWLEATYQQFHAHPELSFQEHASGDVIAAALSTYGFSVQRLGGTGVVGVLVNGDGAVVMSRADMDALPVSEATGLPYASTVPGVMHACGHDVHMTALLGAAKLMAETQGSWSGSFIVVFQPAEEVGGGARALVDDGLTHKVPRPDVVLGQHVMPLPAGMLATAAGPVLSAADSLRITVHGKGSHGSMPHMSVDPVVLAASIVMKLQTIVSRETKPGEFAVVTVGALNAGSTANIIPDRATLLVNIRSYNDTVRTRVLAAIERIVEGECAAAGSPQPADIELYDQFPLTNNDAAATERISEAFAVHFGSEAVTVATPQTASEDFSVLPNAFGAPYSYWFLGGSDPELFVAAQDNDGATPAVPANHSPLFAPVMNPTLSLGVQAHVVAALSYLDGRMPSRSN